MASAMALSPLPASLHLSKTFLHNSNSLYFKSLPASPLSNGTKRLFISRALQETKEKDREGAQSAEQITQKFGLEAGLWKIFGSKEAKEGEGKSKANQTKELLAKYGGAYLATSIFLSLVSFALCYLLVRAGIDIQGLLEKVGIHADETGGKVGTFALAYAAHKAASPIRFPPTVALTPMVANWIRKKAKEDK
ncbi:hypothetical protein AMTRI_Chr11g152640 [Amborella trichopoda]|uniref:DUF1279 domain-containing protein n=1 Tax=Amborella trichopoda TaxID=13333 RepID=U5D740_AMBTC|nr:uncharacterized protein LOC18444471 [Amborella trichopoda]ERN16173.1 hypothetical protein AMTR_s00030p00231690 [Amborella trichopoda]|eukprot:XP_006854706.1 uncharacterized protein LOC18444471 [Amborella trichopoda]